MSSAVCVTTTVGATRCARKTTTTTTTRRASSGGDATDTVDEEEGRRRCEDGGVVDDARRWRCVRRRWRCRRRARGRRRTARGARRRGWNSPGLIAAAACRRKGMKVKVFEKVKKYEPFGGPIRLRCDAQGALDSIDPVMAEEVMEKGIITGDGVNGLLDGVVAEWFYRFDTRKPCHENGLPLTLVLSRFELLDILSRGVGEENIEMGGGGKVRAQAGDKVVAAARWQRIHRRRVDRCRRHSIKLRAQMRGSDPENPPLAYRIRRVHGRVCKYCERTENPNTPIRTRLATKYSSDRSNTSSLRTSETENNSTCLLGGARGW